MLPRRQVAASLAISLLAGVTAVRAAPVDSAYAGATACAACHPVQFKSQSASAHAGALCRALGHPLASSLPMPGTLQRPPAYRFEFFLSAGAPHIRIRSATDVMELPLEWAFGAGRQAVTFVTRVDQDWYVEHYATYYPALHAWGPTPGQSELHPKSLPEAAGVLYKTLDPQSGIAGCFQCHSTGPVTFETGGEARLTEASVRCEACHGPAGAHVKNPSRNNIQNPKRLSAEQLSDSCGRCHRPPPAKGVTIDWSYAWNVRHQPVYLNESACFRKSRGALSCLTCHDPHESAGRKAATFYNGRCLSCHTAGRLQPQAVCRAQRSGNCIDCHMPLVSPQAPLRFTNHWIGIYGEGAKLRPTRY